MPYNIISCSGFDVNIVGYFTGGDCMKARLAIVFLFFLIAVIRKWGGEMTGISFNFLTALALGLFPYLIFISVFGNVKIALVIGILGGLIGGFGGGAMFGDDGGEE